MAGVQGFHHVFKAVAVLLFFLPASLEAPAPADKCLPNACNLAQCGKMNDCIAPYAVVKPKGDICGCCDICILQMFEGDTCIDAGEGSHPVTAMCAPGLVCIAGMCEKGK